MKKAILLLAIACAVMLGCRQRPASLKVTDGADSPGLASDEKVLLALDAYNPMYLVNGKGRIIKLKLPWRHLPDSILAEINKLTELEELDCFATTLSDDRLGLLKDLQKLRSFGLARSGITDEGLVYMQKLRSLRYVWLSKERITEEAVEKLKETCPDLTVYLQ